MTVFASYEDALNASPEDMRAAQEYAAHMVPLINSDRAAGRELVTGQREFLEAVARYQKTVPPRHVRLWSRIKYVFGCD